MLDPDIEPSDIDPLDPFDILLDFFAGFFMPLCMVPLFIDELPMPFDWVIDPEPIEPVEPVD